MPTRINCQNAVWVKANWNTFMRRDFTEGTFKI